MQQHFNDRDKAVEKQQKKMRKTDVCSPITPKAVLHESSRHNIQICASNHGAACSKAKNTTRKIDVVHTLSKRTESNAKNLAVPFNFGKEGSSSLGLPAKKAAMEVEVSPKSSQIHDLKLRLQNANLQIAEVVAQSAILVRDMQCAANKEIANATRHLHSSFRLEEKGLNQFEDCSRKIPISSLNTPAGRGLYYMGVHTLEEELASTRKELADCKVMLAELRRQLDRTSSEKEKLEMYLKSSMQTSLKLQDTLVNQRSVMQLEILAAEDRCRNEAALIVQSARNKSKHLQEQLNVALLSKADADRSLRDCIQLLCHAQRELLTSNLLGKRQCCCQQTLQQLEHAQKQVEVERYNLDEAHAQNGIAWTVLECVWEGAVESILQSGGSHAAEQNSNADTPGLYSKQIKKLSEQTQKCSYSVEEEPTPLKCEKFPDTPRSVLRRNGQRRSRPELSPEDVLRKSLMKSEYEVEILGDKVDELRIVLEKVTTLLDCISKSSVTGHELECKSRCEVQKMCKKLWNEYDRSKRPWSVLVG